MKETVFSIRNPRFIEIGVEIQLLGVEFEPKKVKNVWETLGSKNGRKHAKKSR